MMYSLLSDTCKWMSAIDDYKSLAHISIPGTHESCSRKGAANVTPDLDSIIATQYYECTITTQLSAGIRYLDMRCCIVDDKLAVYHGDYYLNIDFDEVLHECLTFLAENKSETIIIRIRRETTPTAKKKFMDVFTRRYAEFLDKMYLMPQIPLIGEVRGKIVLLSNESILSSVHQSLTRVQDDFSQMRASDKLEKVLAFIQETIKVNRKPTIETLYINHCNAMKPPCLCLQSFAQDLLKLLTKSFKEGLKGEHVDFARYEVARIGIIVMDFYSEAMVAEIIKRNENKHLLDFPILTIANKNQG
ncbi:1-phosphatidylinositol phosphodiesterase [Sodalis praecaptivus]|uniref:phosphatidylinositol-specific phospholipase C domain-containing protein n=1 Tax=Sodalis praecaptivus TaxID=1239307 RepID=UPI0027FA90ED|nr:phosphatidylinositol-specific phospholipase C domain-containing protein [Sodalis praecaptivus]CAJ0995215.1 1-phosphatidylinositol phosphodiesterase [Sodalis praecaptivus]